jgi:hypothetical protein
VKLRERQFTDPMSAKAGIAYLISEGWQIDLYGLNKSLPGGITDRDWMNIANHCMNFLLEQVAKEKVIPIARFKR